MRTRAAYIIGGAGTGKSTMMAELLDGLDAELGELEDIHVRREDRGGRDRWLRGHYFTGRATGLYLGVMRPEFPGSDGLDRMSSPPGIEWLGLGDLPEVILGEGATLSTRTFQDALAGATDLRVVHLTTEEWLRELRFEIRGSEQSESFVANTATRARNLAAYLRKGGVDVVDVDSGDPAAWDAVLADLRAHALGELVCGPSSVGPQLCSCRTPFRWPTLVVTEPTGSRSGTKTRRSSS